jgi:hypothetical protein
MNNKIKIKKKSKDYTENTKKLSKVTFSEHGLVAMKGIHTYIYTCVHIYIYTCVCVYIYILYKYNF